MSDFKLFIYKIFSLSDLIQFHLCIQFSKKIKLFTHIVSKEFSTKFQFGNKNDFYLLLQKMNKLLQFYLQKYFNLFSFKKSDLYELLNKI